ncbi:MAG: hypothetical protein WEB51_07560 [Mycobacterium sp.]
MIGQRAEERIPSHGEQLAAYRYTPDRAGASVPCVVMAHGFSATRDDGLPAYAEAFRDAGFAVILFDYRHFGASTGQPRQTACRPSAGSRRAFCCGRCRRRYVTGWGRYWVARRR